MLTLAAANPDWLAGLSQVRAHNSSGCFKHQEVPALEAGDGECKGLKEIRVEYFVITAGPSRGRHLPANKSPHV